MKSAALVTYGVKVKKSLYEGKNYSIMALSLEN